MEKRMRKYAVVHIQHCEISLDWWNDPWQTDSGKETYVNNGVCYIFRWDSSEEEKKKVQAGTQGT